MNRYIVKATVQIVTFSVLTVLGSFAIFRLFDYFQPDVNTVIFAGAALVIGYTFYNLVKIQASILESRDRLKNRE